MDKIKSSLEDVHKRKFHFFQKLCTFLLFNKYSFTYDHDRWQIYLNEDIITEKQFREIQECCKIYNELEDNFEFNIEIKNSLHIHCQAK